MTSFRGTQRQSWSEFALLKSIFLNYVLLTSVDRIILFAVALPKYTYLFRFFFLCLSQSISEPDNPFSDDLEFYHVHIESAFRDSGYYDGVLDKSPFDLKPSLAALMGKGLSEKEAAAIVDEIVAKANKTKLEKAPDNDDVYVPGLDKCFMERNNFKNDRSGEIKMNNLNENAIRLAAQNDKGSQISDKKGKPAYRSEDKKGEMKPKVMKTGQETGDKAYERPKSLERGTLQTSDTTIESSANRHDSSPDSEYQSGKESLASDSDNTNDAHTPGSEVESSVDTGEVFTNTGATSAGTDKMDTERTTEKLYYFINRIFLH